jgi:hypothetical protein
MTSGLERFCDLKSEFFLSKMLCIQERDVVSLPEPPLYIVHFVTLQSYRVVRPLFVISTPIPFRFLLPIRRQ